MKTASFSLLLILSLLPLLSSARPCKTLFISYYAVSSTHDTSSSSSTAAVPSRYFAVYRVISFLPSRPHKSPLHLDRASYPLRRSTPDIRSGSALASSLQDRARDILVVVAGLLFGAGCGAITAATMYIVYSLVAHRREICGSDDGWDSESNSEFPESPKKMGYVTIADPMVVTAGKEVAGN